MTELEKLIDHLKNLPSGDEPVPKQFKQGFDACIWEVQVYANNQASRGKLRADSKT